jgi:hypothetical protein
MSNDSKNKIQFFYTWWNYEKARFWFWPIVVSFTIFFGLFAGIQGAFVGFFYGLVGAGFLLYESLPGNKKAR